MGSTPHHEGTKKNNNGQACGQARATAALSDGNEAELIMLGLFLRLGSCLRVFVVSGSP
jgi:hypothetical protein